MKLSRGVRLTDSEAWTMRVESPFCQSSLCAVKRRHVAFLAAVDASVLVAEHLADGWREHHLDPLHSTSPHCRLTMSWQSRGEEYGEE